MDIDDAYDLLKAHPDFRVLRRFRPPDQYASPDGTEQLRKGIIVDVETTGMVHGVDQIIELGMVSFEYCARTGRVLAVIARYDGLEDPGMPIPPASTAVHGITDAMVKDHRLDERRIIEVLDGADLVVAHNAGFDRPFLENRIPRFSELAWGCSLKQVRWADMGIGSAKLEYLAYVHGLFHHAHRAMDDCEVLLHILQAPREDGSHSAFSSLLEAVATPAYRIVALASPFESKDVLKARGYRWNPVRTAWWVELAGREAAKSEVAWLRSAVYGGRQCKIEFGNLTPYVRFSARQPELKVQAFRAIEAGVGELGGRTDVS